MKKVFGFIFLAALLLGSCVWIWIKKTEKTEIDLSFFNFSYEDQTVTIELINAGDVTCYMPAPVLHRTIHAESEDGDALGGSTLFYAQSLRAIPVAPGKGLKNIIDLSELLPLKYRTQDNQRVKELYFQLVYQDADVSYPTDSLFIRRCGSYVYNCKATIYDGKIKSVEKIFSHS